MNWPENTDYAEAIQNPRANLADPELKQGEAAANAMGMPIVRSGNFADVYEVRCSSGNSYAVKCFTREVRDLQSRYQAISDHLSRARLPFAVEFQYQEKGILIKGSWFPILKMRWVEGLTLNRFVDEHADKPRILDQLAGMWVKLAKKLRKAKMAHADLQHGNVILVSGKTASSLALKLIDYDGMFVPALVHTASGEVGHPNFQHPERIAHGFYNAEVDRFSHLLIYTALRTLSLGGRKLWQKYDNGETLLFRESDLKNPSSAPVFQDLWDSSRPLVRTLAGRLLLACQGSFDDVPLLDEVVAAGQPVPLTPQQEERVAGILDAGRIRAVRAAPLEGYAIRPPEISAATVDLAAYDVKPPEVTESRLEWLTPANEAARQPDLDAEPEGIEETELVEESDAEAGKQRAGSKLGAAITFAVVGLLLFVGGALISAPFPQTALVLLSFFVLFMAIGTGVAGATGDHELGANIALGGTGLAWWMAGWYWLDSIVGRIVVCLLAGFLFFCHLGLCFEVKRRRSPGQARALRITGFSGLGLLLLTVVIALAVRGTADPQPNSTQRPARQVPPKPPDVPPVNFAGGHRGLTAIAFAPDGKTAITGGGGHIISWDVSRLGMASPSYRARPKRAARKVRELRLGKNGKADLSGSSYDPQRSVSFLAFSTKRREVLAAAGMTLLLISPDSNYVSQRLLPGDGEIVGGSFYDDPDVPANRPAPFVYAHSSGTIIRWNWLDAAESKGQVLAGLARAAFTADGHKALAVPLTSPEILLWDVANGSEVGKTKLGGARVAVSRDGKLALSSTLNYMNLGESTPAASTAGQLPLPPGEITAVALSPRGKHAIATTAGGQLHLWDVSTRTEIMRLKIDAATAPGAAHSHTVAFSPDGQHAIWGSMDGTLQWLTLPKESP